MSKFHKSKKILSILIPIATSLSMCGVFASSCSKKASIITKFDAKLIGAEKGTIITKVDSRNHVTISGVSDDFAATDLDFNNGIFSHEGKTYSIKEISGGAFNSTPNLKGKLIIPSSIEVIGDQAFKDCKNLNSELVLNTGLLTIGNGAFEGCYFFSDLLIPDSVTSIGERAFAKTIALNGTLKLPPTLKTTQGSQKQGPSRNWYCRFEFLVLNLRETGTLTIPANHAGKPFEGIFKIG